MQLARLSAATLLLACAGPSIRSPACRMATDDPFRPNNPPLEPPTINAIQELISSADPPEKVAQRAVQARAQPRSRIGTAQQPSLCYRRAWPTRTMS